MLHWLFGHDYGVWIIAIAIIGGLVNVLYYRIVMKPKAAYVMSLENPELAGKFLGMKIALYLNAVIGVLFGIVGIIYRAMM